VRFVASPVTEYDEVLLGYQPFDPADSPRELHHTQKPTMTKKPFSPMLFNIYLFIKEPIRR